MDPAGRRDPSLVPPIDDGADVKRQLRVAENIREVEPVVSLIIRRRLGRGDGGDVQEIADVHSDAIVRLLARISGAGTDPSSAPIAELRSYAAVVAHHACDEYLRRKHPQRWRLQNRLRYILTHAPWFALWQANEELVAGLNQWTGQAPISITTLQDLKSNVPDVTDALESAASGDTRHAGPSLLAFFRLVNAPLALADLVNLASDVWQTRSDAPHSGDGAAMAEPRDAAPRADESLALREHLTRVWQAIRELPHRQQQALLLNLRDNNGRDVLDLLPLTGVATIREIATTLGMEARELAALWPNLPLQDTAIADRLGITRQQVINLRKCARERLARRTIDASAQRKVGPAVVRKWSQRL